MADTLAKHKQMWRDKPLLREIYFDWYGMMAKEMVEGKTVELGSGSGNFKEFMPQTVSSDIDPKPWLDKVFDAHKMPFKSGTVSNLVMVDVFHHLAHPIKFLHEAGRVLRKGGRLLMIEPYPSPFSLLIYKLFHPEPFKFDIDYFEQRKAGKKLPWDSNQAIPYLIFFKNKKRFMRIFGNDLAIYKQEFFSFLTYPLSGGFENRQFYPTGFKPVLDKIEKLMQPLIPYLAFRCFVVLERK